MSVCAKTLLLWDIQPKQNLAPGDACPSPAGGSPGHPAGRTGCTGGCGTQLGPGCTHREKRHMKLENWGPQIRSLLMDEEALLVLCIRCWGEAPPEKQFMCYPRALSKRLIPPLPIHLAGQCGWLRSSLTYARAAIVPNQRLCVVPLSGLSPLPCAAPAQLCGPARAARPCPGRSASLAPRGCQSDFGPRVRQSRLARE